MSDGATRRAAGEQAGAATPGDPVERLLDALFDRLAGTGAAGRRALAEAEDHLRSAVESGVAEGLDEQQAAERAVARFGPVEPVARELRQVHLGTLGWLRPAFVGCWLAGGVGLLAVGASGVLAELAGRLFGAEFVAADAPGVTYTAVRCADYLRLAPGAASCAAAAAEDHWGELVASRVLAGVLGALGLLLLWWLRRRTALGRPEWTPPEGTVAVPLACLFGLAGLGLGALVLLEALAGDHQQLGGFLAAAVAALGAAPVTALAWWARRRATRHTAR